MHEAPSGSHTRWRIDADLLIPGRGDPVDDAVLMVDDGSIVYAGRREDAPPTQNDAEVVRTGVVMPGLWDCHTHLPGLPATPPLQPNRMVLDPSATRAARSVPDLRAALDAGMTSIRELGGLGVYLADAVDEGCIDGPTVYAAGALLSPTGGHGDLHDIPLEWMRDSAHRDGSAFRMCDGEAECAKATREQLRRGARVIKLCATGGGGSIRDDPRHQQFTVAEMRAIVEVAAMADRVVAAHCGGKSGVMAALEAGVRTIEHGIMLDDEACDAMVESGAILVTTLTLPLHVLARPDLPDWMRRKGQLVAQHHTESVSRAYERGVQIAMGTDISLSAASRDPSAWGTNGQEIALLGARGMSPLQAIEAATANGPLTVGPQAPATGQLVAGYDADFITLDSNPLDDLSVLGDPQRITGVWKSGRSVKLVVSPTPSRR